ncbi:hypothetical protein GCM10023334_039290 [Nonomuraea thailandensis]|nr:hypothetical protein [Nonomuraea thailandensis]
MPAMVIPAADLPEDATMPPKELMQLVGVRARATLWHWDRKGIGPTKYVINARTIRYSRSEVRAWLLDGAKRVPRDRTARAGLGGDVALA